MTVSASLLFFWFCFYVRGRFVYSLVILSLCVLFAGAFWHHGRWNWVAEHDLMSFCADESLPVCVRARMLNEGKFLAADREAHFDAIEPKDKTTFRIQPLSIRDGERWRPVSGQCNLTVFGKAPDFQFGDEVEIFGHLDCYRRPTTPGNFDARNYFRSQQLFCSINVYVRDSISIINPAATFSHFALRSRLRSELNRLLWKFNSGDQAGFASAILLGNRSQIPKEQRELFLVTGTAHLLAISGLHVGILASLFLFLYKIGLLRRNYALVATILFVFFYAWLVEFRPPVVRATILLSLFCTGKLIGRSGLEFDLLAIAGIIVLVLNPSDLFNLGPQLSFLAVATLIVFKAWLFPELSTDPIDKLIRNTRSTTIRIVNSFAWRVCQLVLVSLMIWLIGLPLVANQFHLVTPIACVANPIVIYPVTIALFASLGICLFGGWFPFAGQFFGKIMSTCLGFVSLSIEKLESIDWGHWWTAGPTVFAVILFYSTFLLLCVVSSKDTPRKQMIWLTAWVILVWLLPIELKKSFGHSSPKCTIVDVGHGSGVVFQLPNGHTLLYDAGSLSSSQFAADSVSNLLWSEQIEHLDAIVISHSDIDHYNAIPDLLERFSVGVVYVGEPMLSKDSESNKKLLDFFGRCGVKLRKLAWDDFVDFPNPARLDVLSPPQLGTFDGDNSDSVVILATLGQKKVLMPGDLEGNGMRLLLQSQPIDCDLVLMPHHGSRNSRPKEFVEWCTPELAVISTGRNKLDPAVVETVSETGCNVFTTVECGTLCFEFSENESLRVSHFYDGKWQHTR